MKPREEIETALAPFLAHHQELGVEFGTRETLVAPVDEPRR
jgi:hypothetical protein